MLSSWDRHGICMGSAWAGTLCAGAAVRGEPAAVRALQEADVAVFGGGAAGAAGQRGAVGHELQQQRVDPLLHTLQERVRAAQIPAGPCGQEHHQLRGRR